MLRGDLINRLADESQGLKYDDIKYIVDVFFEEIGNALVQGQRVEIRGFGSFTPKCRAARMARNPKSGDQVSVGERKFVHFKSGKILKAASIRQDG
ncbi:MAG: integration host factor subunit beta [Alphaproteobacteria bacterium]|nr:integration host factor subunit beta [Alphaproteobacteria bacterium]